MEKNNTLFDSIRTDLSRKGLRIVGENVDKPWGAYFLIDEQQTEAFIKAFFSHVTLPPFKPNLKLSPKILLVAPN